MADKRAVAPDNTAVRVALWRALHVEVDPAPHVFEDEMGLKLVAPEEGWHSRPDMSPFTRAFRASIVARARFVEDLLVERVAGWWRRPDWEQYFQRSWARHGSIRRPTARRTISSRPCWLRAR